MDLADVPRHRPLAFDKMEALIKEMQDPETGVPVRSQKLFLTYIPAAFMGYDLVEWLMERFNLDETSNVEAINLANQLCQFGYFFPVNDSKNLVLKDDSSLYRFQSPYYWPWQSTRPGGGSGSACAASLGPDNVEYAIYLVKRTLRNKQRHGLEEYELEALANLKKNLAAKWDFITMQAEEQVRLAKDRKKGDKIVSDSQERAYWRVVRPPPGVPSALEACPVPVRARALRNKQREIQFLTKEIEYLKSTLEKTCVKTSVAAEALVAFAETLAPYDPWIAPPLPSNPWVSDDTTFWQINSPLVDVPSEKRVQRWALSIEELVSDPTGIQEFTGFLRKEYSHENIRFWLAVVDLRRSSAKQIPQKLQQIYEEFLKSGAPCEINIDGATAEQAAAGVKSGSRFAFDQAADHVFNLLLKKDCYPRFVRSEHFQRLLAEGRNVHQKKAKFFNFGGGGQVKKKPGTASTGSSSSGGAPGASGAAGAGAGLSRRRGSERSLSGSAHELAYNAARTSETPTHSHSQSNLADIAPFREGSSEEETSSTETSRGRRLPQQSTLDGGLRGAPPPLRRLSAVEPRGPPSPPPGPAPAVSTCVTPPTPPVVSASVTVSSLSSITEVEHTTPSSSSSTTPVTTAVSLTEVSSPVRGMSTSPVKIVATVEASTWSPVMTSITVTDTPGDVSPPLVEQTSCSSELPTSRTSSCSSPPVSAPAVTLCESSDATSAVIAASSVASMTIVPTPSSSASTPSVSCATPGGRRPSLPNPAPECAVSSPRVAPECAVSSPRVAPECAVSSPRVAPECAVSSPRVAPECAVSSPRVAPECAVSSPRVAPECAMSSPRVAPQCPVSSPRVAPQCPVSSPRVALECPVSSPRVALECPVSSPRVALECPVSSPRVALECPVSSPRVALECPVSSPRVALECPVSSPRVALECPVSSPRVALECPVSSPRVAPLAECEVPAVEEDRPEPPADPALPPPTSTTRPDTDVTITIAHKDALSSQSEHNVKSDNNSSDCKQRNDICPWEDENACESDAPFVKTYATLGYL